MALLSRTASDTAPSTSGTAAVRMRYRRAVSDAAPADASAAAIIIHICAMSFASADAGRGYCAHRRAERARAPPKEW